MFTIENIFDSNPANLVIPITQYETVVFSFMPNTKEKWCTYTFVQQGDDGQAYVIAEPVETMPRNRAGWTAYWQILGYMKQNLCADEYKRFHEHAKTTWTGGFAKQFALFDQGQTTFDDSGALFADDVEERLEELRSKEDGS